MDFERESQRIRFYIVTNSFQLVSHLYVVVLIIFLLLASVARRGASTRKKRNSLISDCRI